MTVNTVLMNIKILKTLIDLKETKYNYILYSLLYFKYKRLYDNASELYNEFPEICFD